MHVRAVNLVRGGVRRAFVGACHVSRKSQTVNVEASRTHQLTGRTWDAVVVGGGHNGLIAAAYLAKAGRQVAVLERRHIVGGAAVTEEIVPGFKFSRASYLLSLLRPAIIKELELKRHGLHLLPRSPSSFTPTARATAGGGGAPEYLLMGPDAAATHAQISKFSTRDADAYPRYEAMLERFSYMIEPLLDTVPPESPPPGTASQPWRERLQHAATYGGILRRAAALGHPDLLAFAELLLAPASKVLNKWFELPASPSRIGSFVYKGADGAGEIRATLYVRGGMGAVSDAIASSALEAGAVIATNAEVAEIVVEGADSAGEGGVVTGVLLTDGTLVRAKNVLSNATPRVTFEKLVRESSMPPDFLTAIKGIDYSSGTTKINVAVDRLPSFIACPRSPSDAPGPEHQGTIHLGADSQAKQAARLPGCEHHEEFAERCYSLIDEYAPGFSSSIIGADILTPPDLERVLGGNIFHGAMGLDALFQLRPVQGSSGYRTPIKGLYLCGAGAHPGGGVMGAPGRNCASVVLKDD
eukprot:jgi/Mesen1/4267/ME000022S03557